MADGSLFGVLWHQNPHQVLFRAADLFCGGGGTTQGILQAIPPRPEIGYSPVLAAVNHDPYAIQTHGENHPDTQHFLENVFDVRPWLATRGGKLHLLAGSPDCTHHSRARGKAPLNANRRSLAEVYIQWAKEVRPDVMTAENVPEFVEWGPLYGEDADPTLRGRPIPERKGELFQAWVSSIRELGYTVEWQLLRACDYGAPTSRNRLFIVMRCDGKPIRWPEPTHGPGKKPYRVARECIDWDIPSRSLFDRVSMSEKTLRRVAAGIERFVLGSATPFLLCLSHGGRLEDLNRPMNTLTAYPKGGDRALVAPTLVLAAQGSKSPTERRVLDLDKPLPTITSGGNRFAVAPVSLVTVGYGERPGQAPRVASLDKPMNTIVGSGKSALCTVDLASVASPRARQVAKFLSAYGTQDYGDVVTVNVQGQTCVLDDIGFRMLDPEELKVAQGFPKNYVFRGTKAQKTASIGNAVVPHVMEALVRALFPEFVGE